MKPLFSSSQNHQLARSKPLPCNTTTPNTTIPATTNTAISCFEPTSVLDLRRSSSPASASAACVSDSTAGILGASGVLSDDSPLPFLLVDDWDSVIWDLEQKDDFAPTLKYLTSAPSETLNPNSKPLEFDDHSPPPHLLDFTLSPLPVNTGTGTGTGTYMNTRTCASIQDCDPFNFSPHERGGFNQVLHSSTNENLCFDRPQMEQLIRAVESVESNDLPLAQSILARLNQRSLSPAGKPLQRAAFYFKEALESLILLGGGGSNRSRLRTGFLSPVEIVHKMGACKSFSEISPVTQFVNFTSNQAFLEALDGVDFIHAIDFEIGIGEQWASFMLEISIRARVSRIPSPALRITAIIAEETMEISLVRENLCRFAQELGLPFEIAFVDVTTFESLALGAIRFLACETIAVRFSPVIFRQLGMSGSIAGFLHVLRRISPRIAVFVDSEGQQYELRPSFRHNFVDGLNFYSALLESLDAAAVNVSMEEMRKIERFLLRPKISAAVAAAGTRISPWQELFFGAGMSPIPFSEFSESQAECIVTRAPIRGFHVVKRNASMALCWQGRELVATSAWRF